jgi:protease-4
LLTPPPIIAPPLPPKPRKSRGWMITTIILFVLLVFSVFAIFTQFVSNAFSFNDGLKGGITREIGPRLEECILEDHDAANKIAVIPVEGTITDQSTDRMDNSMVDVIRAQLDRAKKDHRVKAVVLKVDSPGGEVLATDEIGKAIARFQEDSGKPVICSMGSLAASGGYYIATQCRWIVANPLTITGSIGVILDTWNYRGLMDKVGLAPVTYKSGKFKDMLSGERSTNEIPVEEHAMVQSLIDETYQQFKGIVAEGRRAAHEKNKKEGRALVADWANYADGRVFSGSQACKLGFVDQLGDFRDAVKRAREIAGLHNANLVEYRERYDISNFLRLLGRSESSRTIKLDLGTELPKLQAGKLYFLSPTFVN